MIYSLEKNQSAEIKDARKNLTFLWKEWLDKAILANERAIKEVNALDEQSKRELEVSLLKIVSRLPGSEDHCSSIVKGLLNLDDKPYQEYLKSHFAVVLYKTAYESIAKKIDLYTNAANSFVEQERLSGALGQYFFKVKNLTLVASKMSALEFNLQSRTEFQPKVQLAKDKSIKDVEKDAVNLESHLKELEPKYHKFIKNFILANSIESDYQVYKMEVFRHLFHQSVIWSITETLNSYSAPAKKAA